MSYTSRVIVSRRNRFLEACALKLRDMDCAADRANEPRTLKTKVLNRAAEARTLKTRVMDCAIDCAIETRTLKPRVMNCAVKARTLRTRVMDCAIDCAIEPTRETMLILGIMIGFEALWSPWTWAAPMDPNKGVTVWALSPLGSQLHVSGQ